MNRPLRRISVFCLALVLALMGWATWIQGAKASDYREDPHNPRVNIAKYSAPLGNILVDGQPVTGSAATSSSLKYKRTYKDGPLYAPVTGFSSQIFGSTQLESLYGDLLGGSDSRLQNPADTLLHERPKGGDVATTIDPKVQKAGYDALGDKTGAAIALDPATGRILGMVSTPSYDPGKFAGSGTADQKAWQALANDSAQPNLNRALRQPLPPGSTFKLVVAAAALENGLYSSVDQPTTSPNPYTLPNTRTQLTNESASAPCENATIRTALQYSCNTVFAKMAVDLGKDKVRAQAEKFGFNDAKMDVPVRATKSVYPSDMDQAQTALSGIGQFDDQATPLQMAMVAAAIADGGDLKTPQLVDKLTDGGGNTVQQNDPKTYHKAMSSRTAAQLRSAMQTVVDKGTGSNAKIDGVTVGGKTGTAQHGVDNSGTPYAWFVSYGDDGKGHQVAVAVMVEDGHAARNEVSGNGLAAPIAKAMMQAALS
ncbi:penicillin-binding protein [Streptomyces noursei ZPM]|uniref:Penicillin-binding protein n=1 Tax=Streptomyces noursei TaxID=1971 RepID=A0A059W201_STRNR|nr:penicillin-binding transpeptidase domain-containing protein [Streptomyces noursei]AKA03913.1 penicillin-binding protein [Streptomyces noursei ZPM]AIA03635.1 penicillin-binding protein [Streptomyces noursei]EOS99343.1 penicillin-binding protein [Streptomyces noursei CCRC 11814]EXU87770.1 penicillin-binding protein [Streptomyces noursei PD-1]MCZ0972414.1 penicillin-binding transpeptidase domain-containing protein [Streptomyces noursei]